MKTRVLVVIASLLGAPLAAQSDLHATFDRVLDTYVRDGQVYYRALQIERGPLDRYIASLDVPADRMSAWTSDQQMAFWVNAYNALVLRTVVNGYPIRGGFDGYPENSVRQISGAFERIRHPVGGRLLSLDEIETEVLAGFGDARVFLLLGRGALDSSRLRSEAITADRLGRQLEDAVRECATRAACVRLDAGAQLLVVTPMIGWRADAFVATFAGAANGRWADRSPIERAVAAMIHPHLFQSEQEFLEADRFRMTFGDFDWRLNDLGSYLFSTGSAASGPDHRPGLAPKHPKLWKTGTTP